MGGFSSIMKQELIKSQTKLNSYGRLNEMDENFDMKKEFDFIKKDILRIIKPLYGIQDINCNNPDFVVKINDYINKLPKSDDLRKSYDETKNRLINYSNKIETYSKQSFAKMINQYQQNLQKRDIKFRLVDNNRLRVDCLEIELKIEKGQIRVLYNKITIIPWVSIHSSQELEKYEKQALKRLKDCEIDQKILPIVVKKSYERVYFYRKRNNKTNPHLVSIKNLHKVLIKEVFNYQIDNRRSYNSEFKGVFLPEWAFVYNLDRYRSMMQSIAPEFQLSFETGSQSQTEKEGVVLNGLNPNFDYKKFCFLKGRSTY
jgi:hypothetical protein